jgi:hypothetical protein
MVASTGGTLSLGEGTDLGSIGVWTFAFGGQPIGKVREAAAELDELGYGAVWFGEAFGREALSLASLLLRFLLGIGGHRSPKQQPVPGVNGFIQPEPRPLETMRDYLEAMDKAPLQGFEVQPRRVLAALGPQMLRLAAEKTWGAHPYFVPVEHTAKAWEILGPEPVLAVEQAVVLGSDRDVARTQTGEQSDRRDAQITRLKNEITALKRQLTEATSMTVYTADWTASILEGPTGSGKAEFRREDEDFEELSAVFRSGEQIVAGNADPPGLGERTQTSRDISPEPGRGS